MYDDLRCVVWKEWRSMFRVRGGRMQSALTLISPIGITLFLAISAGRDWADEVPSVLASFLAPMILVLLLVPDSFAGEKERHTLATLLSTRLPDRAILYGKLGLAVAVGWLGTVIVLALGIIVANISEPGGGFFFYSAQILYVNLVFPLLSALMIGVAGVFISMRMNTVQEASQLLAAIFMLPPMLGGFGLTFFLRSGDGGIDRLRDVFGALGSPAGLAAVTAALVAVDIALLVLVTRRFRRSRLILG